MIQCALCPRRRGPVPPCGPVPARVLLIGEGPSYEEDRQGVPFSGRTGQELDQTYLTIANLPRSVVHITNARLCSEKRYENPTPEQALACAAVHLGETLARVKPQIVVPMGAAACSLFPGINLNLDHGIPQPGAWGSWRGILFPQFHPSAGMHSRGYMIPLMQDFDSLRKMIAALDRGEFEYPYDPFPNPDYRVCRTEQDLNDYLPNGEVEFLACDTESLPDGRAYCMTLSHTPGTGRLIYAKNRRLLEELAATITNCGFADVSEYIHLLFHNYLYDVAPFDEIDLPIGPFSDTMVRAYNLCLGGGGDDDEESRAGRGSLGLKTLAYRHCAIRMTSFDDTVHPHSIPHVLNYLYSAADVFKPGAHDPAICTCNHHKTMHDPRGKTGKLFGACRSCPCDRFTTRKKPKPSLDDKAFNQLYLKITNIILDLDSGKNINPWDRIKQWEPPADSNMMIDVCGPIPVPSIEHVPEPSLLRYACRDADATLRLHLKLRGLRPWIFY